MCKDNGIKLLLVKAPSQYPYWYDEYDSFVKDYANKNEIDYLNILEYVEEIGLDFSQDTYDGGLHLNLTGAIKNSNFFSEYLKKHYELVDYKNDPMYEKLLELYEKQK